MTQAQDDKRYHKFVEDIRCLLRKWNASGVDLFLKLREAEMTGIWKLPKIHTCFEDFLKREFPDTLGVHRYTHVVRMIEEYGDEFARKVGVEPAHVLLNEHVISDPKKKGEVVASIEYHIKRDGCSPGLQKIREIIRSVAPETRKPCSEVKGAREEKITKDENERLRRRVKELEEELAAAKKEIASLKRENNKLKRAASRMQAEAT